MLEIDLLFQQVYGDASDTCDSANESTHLQMSFAIINPFRGLNNKRTQKFLAIAKKATFVAKVSGTPLGKELGSS